MSKQLKNILIIKPSALGDIVLALPALAALRKSFPDAKISWLVRPAFASLLQGHPYLDNIILFDRKFLGKAWCDPAATKALWTLIGQLRRAKFDAVIDFQGLFRTASIGWLTGCKNRIGMANAREFGHIFYTQKIPQTKQDIHLVDYYLKITRAAGADYTEPEFVLPQDESAAESVTKLLNDHNIPSDNYAVFVPGSAHDDKCWPVENFAALAEKINAQFGMSIIATGTEPEKAVVEKIKNIANVTITDLAGKTNIPQLIALLKNAKLVVSNDTGPGHIAAALNVPVILIFGRSNPARVAPYKRPNCFTAVAPNDRGFKPDSIDPAHNIANITVEEVFEKISKQIEP